jgi:hypothetical protein
MNRENPLNRARIARGISLSEVTARTFLSPRVVQKIDEGAFDQLPGGVYARSYIRTFAALVGLDPEAMIEELSTQLPPADDPIPVLRHQVEVASACQFELWDNWVRLALAGGTALHRVSQRLHAASRQCVARSIDAGVLFLSYAALLLLTAWTLDLPIATAFTAAGLELSGPWAVSAAAYYLLCLFGGRTPGDALCGIPASGSVRVAIPRRLFH